MRRLGTAVAIARASSRDVDELGVDVDDVVAAAVDVPIRGAGDVHDGDEDEDGGPGPGGVSHGAETDGDDTGERGKGVSRPKTTPAWRGATSR